jgi:hypothetical protein
MDERVRRADDELRRCTTPLGIPLLAVERSLRAAGLRDLIVERDELRAELEQAREALRFYADPGNHEPRDGAPSLADMDGGDIARDMLAQGWSANLASSRVQDKEGKGR